MELLRLTNLIGSVSDKEAMRLQSLVDERGSACQREPGTQAGKEVLVVREEEDEFRFGHAESVLLVLMSAGNYSRGKTMWKQICEPPSWRWQFKKWFSDHLSEESGAEKREPRSMVLKLDIRDYGIQLLFQKDKYKCLGILGDSVLNKTKLSP